MTVDTRAVEPVPLESTTPCVGALIEEARQHARRRRAFTAVLAAGVAMAGAAAVAVARNGAEQPVGPRAALDSSPTVAISPPCVPTGEVPPVPDSRWAEEAFVSNVPVSAAAARGGPCALVLRYGFHRLGSGNGFGPSPGLSGMVFLYSDGRLIVDTATAQDWFVQWERRLTPAGVEHLHSAVVATLDESRDPTAASGRGETPIHYGDSIVYPKDPQALVRLLMDRSWLSEEDWVAEAATAYRAVWYLTCYETPASGSADSQAAVGTLPSGARAVLRSREWAVLPPGDDGRVVRCVILSRADATVLVDALGGDISVGKANVFPEGLPGPAAPFSVHALMPDGTSGAHGD